MKSTTTVKGAVSCVDEPTTTEASWGPVEWENGNTKSKCELNEIPYIPTNTTEVESALGPVVGNMIFLLLLSYN